MQENEQTAIASAELDALRAELANVKAALATAERMLGEREEIQARTTTTWPCRAVRLTFTHEALGDRKMAPLIYETMAAMSKIDPHMSASGFDDYNGLSVDIEALEMKPLVFHADRAIIKNGTGAIVYGCDLSPSGDIEIEVLGQHNGDGSMTITDIIERQAPEPLCMLHAAQHQAVIDAATTGTGMLEISTNEAGEVCAKRIAPFGIYGNKFPGTIWPEPGKVDFDLNRAYDPMNMTNREGPLKLREDDSKEAPRRRRTDKGEG